MTTLSRRAALAAVLLVAVPLLGFAPALAGDQAPASDQLPGVKGGYSIVKPEPDNPSTTTLDGLNLKLGNVQVKVRGSVIIDTGVGQAGSSGKEH